jgi:outer membrane protein with beta-barrel domain
MKQLKTLAKLALSAAVVSFANFSHAQASNPTATQQLQLSAFGGLTGTYTNFEGGKNLDITAGADLTVLALRKFRPSFEIRGTYPVDSGHISGQKSFILGPKVEYPIGRLHPYADFLIGRGQIDYLNGGFLYNNLLYLSSTSTVYSPGLGLDYDLTPRWAVKADFQYQTWHTPVLPDTSIHPKAITFGVVYHFDFNPHHHRTK